MDKPHCVINPLTNRAVKATSTLGKKLLKDLENGNKSVVEAQKPVAKTSVAKTEVKKPVVKTSVAKTEVQKPVIKTIPKKTVAKSEVGLKEIVDEWNTSSVGILFFQLSQKNESFKSIMKKTSDLTKRKNTVVPSDLFSFNPNLLNALVDKYGATKKGIDIIDEGMRDVVEYINEDVKFPDEIDYKYYTKYMSGSNKKKFSFLTTDKLKK